MRARALALSWKKSLLWTGAALLAWTYAQSVARAADARDFTFFVCSDTHLGADRPDATPPVLKAQVLEDTRAKIERVGAIGGYIGQRLAANREGYLAPFDIERFVRMVEEKRQRDWWWIGEQPGKWLESAVLASAQAGDRALEEKARRMLARLIAAQEPSGYLGITDPAVRTPAQPLRGMDPYELYFTLHGLLTAHAQWGSAEALAAARKLGDYFTATIGPGKAEFWPSPYRPPENTNTIICPQYTYVPAGTPRARQLYDHSEIAGHTAHYSWEGTLLIDPMLRLYEATGEERYLAWAKWVVSSIDRWSGWNAFSNLDKVAAGTMGVHELQPYVHAHTFQMNFLGFLRLYRATGDASLLAKVRGAWDDIAARQLYITGGVSVGEHYEPGYTRPLTGAVVETCATMSWMQLTFALLELTGEPKYADTLERLLFNHVFASQTIDGDSYRYHTPPSGFAPDDYFHGPDCCTGSGHRLAVLLPTFFYGGGTDGIFVHQFVSSTATRAGGKEGGSLTLRTETRYPQEETVAIKVQEAHGGAVALNVRIPGWCEAPALSVNGARVEAKAGTYARIDRTWKAGDVVTLTLPMRARWVQHDHFDGPDAPWALVRGPIVYALDTVWWDDAWAPRPFEVGREIGVALEESRTPALVPAPPRALGPACEVVVKTARGAPVRARMLPFTNVGTWYREGEKRPERGSKAFSYAVWLQDAAGPEFATRIAECVRLDELRKTAVDFVVIGDAKSEHEHKVAGNGNTGPFQDRTYRHAGNGGWFSYELKVLTEAPSELVVTYFGGETGAREFDIVVNERTIATQRLGMDKPGEFYEVRYALPFDLVKDKTDALGRKVERVTVKFQARPGNTAGGIFGLRVEKARA